MIVKVQTSKKVNEWFMVDNITEIYFQDKFNFLEKDEKFDLSSENCILFFTNEPPWQYSTIIAKDKVKEIKIKIIFDTVAYICNDKGKTLEKILGCAPIMLSKDNPVFSE